MPTGYTAAVQDGTITTLTEFALACARGFGACISTRDDPGNKAIPERFEPNVPHHDTRIAEKEDEIARLEALSEGDIAIAAEADYAARLRGWQERERERSEHLKRYSAMRALVTAWEAPTGDHKALRNFMIEQLTRSMTFDCGLISDTPLREPAAVWHERKLAEARMALEAYRDMRQQEIDRVERANLWLAQLRDSLMEFEEAMSGGKVGDTLPGMAAGAFRVEGDIIPNAFEAGRAFGKRVGAEQTWVLCGGKVNRYLDAAVNAAWARAGVDPASKTSHSDRARVLISAFMNGFYEVAQRPTIRTTDGGAS